MKSTRIQRDSPLPLYFQLQQILLDRIDRGAWKPGELIPGELELQATYDLSRTTVRQALRALELDGKVVRYRGRGTFVATPKLTHSPEPRNSLTQTLRSRGMAPGWTVLSCGAVPAPRDVAERLGVAAGAPLFRSMRLRLANDEPIGVHVAHVAPPFAGAIDEALLEQPGSLDYLAATGALDGSRAERVLEAVPATAEEADLLGVDVGAPMQRIWRLVVTADGEPLEHLRATYRGDRFQYRVETVATRTPR